MRSTTAKKGEECISAGRGPEYSGCYCGEGRVMQQRCCAMYACSLGPTRCLGVEVQLMSGCRVRFRGRGRV